MHEIKLILQEIFYHELDFVWGYHFVRQESLKKLGDYSRMKMGVWIFLLGVLLLGGCFPMAAPERIPVYDALDKALTAEGALELDLSGQGLTAIPDGLGAVRGLVRLRLRGNDLRVIGNEIGVIAHVPWVDMGRAGVQSLPDDIGLLTVLHTWWLSDNGLEVLPDTLVEMESLRYLNLDRNRLARLPADIGQMQSLRWLRVNGNRLTELPRSITELVGLERLYLAYNRLSVLPDDIGRLQQLDTLVLTGNPLEEGELERVREALPACNVVFRVRQ